MAFRYMNPGLAALLDNDCVSTQVTGEQYSKTGVAFTQTNSAAGVTLPDFAEGDDFWARFDAYVAYSYCHFYCKVPRVANTGVEFHHTGAGAPFYLDVLYSSNYSDQVKDGTDEALNVRVNEVNTFLLHVVYGKANDVQIDFFINGKNFPYNKHTFAITYSNNYASKARLYSVATGAYPDVYFSHVIFSNEEISWRERVISLPVAATTTDMAAGASGIYVADAANQQLLQSGSLSALAERYGADSVVTGVEVVGNPAYATGAGITALTGISKSGGVVAEHGKCFLTDDTLSKAYDGWGLSGVTVGDLANMQFGWKVGV